MVYFARLIVINELARSNVSNYLYEFIAGIIL